MLGDPSRKYTADGRRTYESRQTPENTMDSFSIQIGSICGGFVSCFAPIRKSVGKGLLLPTDLLLANCRITAEPDLPGKYFLLSPSDDNRPVNEMHCLLLAVES